MDTDTSNSNPSAATTSISTSELLPATTTSTNGLSPATETGTSTNGLSPAVEASTSTNGLSPAVEASTSTSELPPATETGTSTSELVRAIEASTSTSGLSPPTDASGLVHAIEVESGVPPELAADTDSSGPSPVVSTDSSCGPSPAESTDAITAELRPSSAQEQEAEGARSRLRSLWFERCQSRRRKTVSGFPQPAFKILFIGDRCTGKTSLVRRYAHDEFTGRHQVTLGADYTTRTIGWTINTTVRLHLWDITGQEQFSLLTRPSYRHADAAFVVFDSSRPRTLFNTVAWKADLDEKVRLPCGARIPCVLLANKCDLAERCEHVQDARYMERWVQRHGFHGWLEASAKENIGVDEAMECLLMNLMDGAVHRRVGDRLDGPVVLREGEVACACVSERQNAPVVPLGPRVYPGRENSEDLPVGEAVHPSMCPCWC